MILPVLWVPDFLRKHPLLSSGSCRAFPRGIAGDPGKRGGGGERRFSRPAGGVFSSPDDIMYTIPALGNIFEKMP